MPVNLQETSAATVNGIVYIAGGATTNASYSDLAEAYDPESDSWSFATPMPTAIVGGNCAQAALNGKLFVVGGVGNGYLFLPNVQVYTPNVIQNLSMYAGLTIQGQVGATAQIYYENVLNRTNWLALTNFVLSSSPYLFIDTSSPQFPHRFYTAIVSQ